MCGIALILSGVRIIGCDIYRELGDDSPPVSAEVYESDLLVNDLKAALLRRGPDNLGCRKVVLQFKEAAFAEKEDACKDMDEDYCLQVRGTAENFITSSLEFPNTEDSGINGTKYVAELVFLGATLHLRGLIPVFQPLADSSGNLLMYNGEIFGGIQVPADGNDAEALLYALQRCCACDCHGSVNGCCCNEIENKSVAEVLSTIRGPWALVYWQNKSKTIWFGRDAFGRRSLLVHWPTVDDPRFVLSSLSQASSCRKDSDSLVADMAYKPFQWDELPCGIYNIHIKASEAKEQCIEGRLFGEVKKYEWTDPLLNKLIEWERTFVDPKMELSLHGLPLQTELPSGPSKDDIDDLGALLLRQTNLHLDTVGSLMDNLTQSGHVQPAKKVLVALRESVMRRTIVNHIYQTSADHSTEEEQAPMAILFSGGLDSMIIAALLDQCLNSGYAIDLLNVSFDGQLAPDRVSARAGVKELQRIAPHRRWRLVEIDATLSNLTLETKRVMSLIHPSNTYMDLNIGIALWLAAGGDGWVDGEICKHLQKDGPHRYKYKSLARILLVGTGADEQCAGYGRHKTKFRQGGWNALQEEMKLDIQRIWKRNLGRDDRCISDQGKEARFPFLDEDVIRILLKIPLWQIAELDEPVGRGDKKILREVARMLGLEGAAGLPKRAIQFGSRIARESNRKNFGSNRAANQASAGSVEICTTVHH